MTSVWYDRRGKVKTILEADMRLNGGSGFSWSYMPPEGVVGDYGDPTNSGAAGTYDVRNIVTHEAGHYLLLDDLYDGSHLNMTMYGYGATGELKKDTLALGDATGILTIYPN